MIFAVHNLYPSLRPYTAPFFQLSHYQPSKGLYVQGWDDIYYVIGSAIGFTAVRAVAIDWIFRPIARYGGLKRKPSIRFAEQAWLLVYYGFFWSFGMVSFPLSFKWALACSSTDTATGDSISGPIRTTGSISRPSGRNGRRGKWTG